MAQESQWFENNGRMPQFCAGKRVMVELRNGSRPVDSWPADGRDGMRWGFAPETSALSKFDVVRFRIA
jgi:hypothetical protein